jgi:hypothetical protein
VQFQDAPPVIRVEHVSFGPCTPTISPGRALLRAASKILRAASLTYGTRATLPEIARWLRAA